MKFSPEIKTKLSEEEIKYIVDSCLNKGAGNVMREEQVALGRRVLALGDEPWLRKEDWNEDMVISTDGNRVYIIALIAKVSGKGSFSRLIDGILETGLCPVVVCPFASMREILIQWNWRGMRDEAKNKEHWFPQKEFKDNRRKRREAERNKAIYEQTMAGSSATTAYHNTYNQAYNQYAGAALLGSSLGSSTQALNPYFTIKITTI